MTNAGPGDRLTKNQRREAAREKARQLRDQQKKKEKRNRVLLQGGIILGSLAIIAVIALVLVNSVRPAGPGPANMLSGGIRIGQNFEAVPTAAMPAGSTPTPIPAAEGEEQPISIQIFVDYFCPVCRAFDEANREQIASLIEGGAVTYEVHPISFLDRVSLGTRYSSRAANAAACVADNSPDSFWAFDEAMFANQPAEQTAGLSDDQIVDIVLGIDGIQQGDDIEDCIRDEDFRSWVTDITAHAQNFGVPGTDVNTIRGTPTVLVNGQLYQGSPNDAAAFQAFVAQAEGQVFNEESTPTPTPTPSS